MLFMYRHCSGTQPGFCYEGTKEGVWGTEVFHWDPVAAKFSEIRENSQK